MPVSFFFARMVSNLWGFFFEGCFLFFGEVMVEKERGHANLSFSDVFRFVCCFPRCVVLPPPPARRERVFDDDGETTQTCTTETVSCHNETHTHTCAI